MPCNRAISRAMAPGDELSPASPPPPPSSSAIIFFLTSNSGSLLLPPIDIRLVVAGIACGFVAPAVLAGAGGTLHFVIATPTVVAARGDNGGSACFLRRSLRNNWALRFISLCRGRQTAPPTSYLGSCMGCRSVGGRGLVLRLVLRLVLMVVRLRAAKRRSYRKNEVARGHSRTSPGAVARRATPSDSLIDIE